MAILIDYSQVVLATIFVASNSNTGLDENILRHMFLNSLRLIRNKFKNEYGEVVLCVDGKNTWRRALFPYYKASRKKAREESHLDWNELYRIIGMIKTEVDEHFPYKVIHIDQCEADDVIAAICQKYGTVMNEGSEKFLIISTDKDFIQLQRFANVQQYDPVRKVFIEHSNPDAFLIEHVIRGDKGDGVPNILSADNSIIIGERQKTITAGRLAELSKGPDTMEEETKNRYFRNKTLIDLSEIPQHIQDQIVDKYNMEKEKPKSKLYDFFIDKKLKYLLGDIQDFK